MTNPLTIMPALKADVYRDIIRVPENHRRLGSGDPQPEGIVCKVVGPTGSTMAWVRGWDDSDEAIALIDDRLRGQLGVKLGEQATLTFTKPRFGALRWAWNASETPYMISIRLATVSVVLGLVGAGLGAISLWGSP